MAFFDKDNQPLDEQGLAEHIERVLAVPEPRGAELELSYRVVKRLFNPLITGADNIPEQPCLYVGNHSLFALDGFVLGPLMQKELGIFPRGLGDKFLFTVPSIGNFVSKYGAVIGHPAVCSAMMEAGKDLLVFPGGAHEAVKSSSEMYALQWKERLGFVRLAAQHGYTIMPFGIVGPDEFYGHLLEGEDLPDSALGKLLRRAGVLNDNTRPDMLPPVPIGALGTLLPKPQRCYLGFGEPLDLSAHKGKKLTKKKLHSFRDEVAQRIESELSQLLLLREQHRSEDGFLRRLLTL